MVPYDTLNVLTTFSCEVFENFDSISIMYSDVYGIHLGLFFEAELKGVQ